MCQKWHQILQAKYRQTPLEHPMSTAKRPRLPLRPISCSPSKLTRAKVRLKLNPALMEIWHLTHTESSKLPIMVNVKGRIRTAKISSRMDTVHTVTNACTAMNIAWWIRSPDIDTTQTWAFTRAYSSTQRTRADSSTISRLKLKNFQYLREYMLRVTRTHLRSSTSALSQLLSLPIVQTATATVDHLAKVKWLFHNIGF